MGAERDQVPPAAAARISSWITSRTLGHERPGERAPGRRPTSEIWRGADSESRASWGTMNAIKTDTTIDEAVVRAIPALRPLLGRHVELIALDAAPTASGEPKLTADELLGSRIKLPAGVGPLSLDDIERAIAIGATGR